MFRRKIKPSNIHRLGSSQEILDAEIVIVDGKIMKMRDPSGVTIIRQNGYGGLIMTKRRLPNGQ